MADLRRRACLLHEGAGDILEQVREVGFLLVVATERRARLLADNGEHRLVVEPRIVQPVEQVDGAGDPRWPDRPPPRR